MITPNKIPYDTIPGMIKWALDQKGFTTAQIESQKGVRYEGDDRYDEWSGWHYKKDIDQLVAQRLSLNPSVWGRNRTSNEFYVAVTRAVAALKKSEQIHAWKVSGRLVLRLAARPTDRIPIPRIDHTGSGISLPRTELVWGAPTEKEFGSMFMSILRGGRKDNTYKFALARAILEYCQEWAHGMADGAGSPPRNEISYEYFAEKFLRYYWHQEFKFRMNQHSHAERTPAVIRAIRDSFDEEDIPATFTHTKPKDREKAKELILKGVFGSVASNNSYVIQKFQNITSRRAVQNDLFYEIDHDAKKILLRRGVFEFFNKYNGILSGLVLAEWAKFLEKRNGGLPQLVAKIEANDVKRGNLVSMRTILHKYQCHCFYCACRLEKGWIDVDHFIPWSYIFNDDTWNLVLACRDCNCKKNNALADEEFRDELIKRNEEYYNILKKMKKSIDAIDVRNGWKSEIRNHYATCEEYGFARIGLP